MNRQVLATGQLGLQLSYAKRAFYLNINDFTESFGFNYQLNTLQKIDERIQEIRMQVQEPQMAHSSSNRGIKEEHTWNSWYAFVSQKTYDILLSAITIIFYNITIYE